MASVATVTDNSTERDALLDQVISAYQDGEKVSSIQKRLGVPRSTIYWALQRAGVAPKRRADALAGNRKQMASLFEVIDIQQQWIERAVVVLNRHNEQLARTAPHIGTLLNRLSEGGPT